MNLFQKALLFWFISLIIQKIIFIGVLLWYRKKLQSKQSYACIRRCYLILTYFFSLFHLTCLTIVLSVFRIFIEFIVLCMILYCTLHLCFLFFNNVNELIRCQFYVLSLVLGICIFILNILLINYFCSNASDHPAFNSFYYFVLITSSMGVASSFSNVLYFFICYSKNSQEDLIMLTMIKVDLVSTIDEECPICLEELKNSEEKMVIKTECGHKFHDICIKESLNTSDKCPMCRRAFYFHPCL